MIVDTNIIIDVLDVSSPFSAAAQSALESAAAYMTLTINHIILAELSTRFGNFAAVEAELSALALSIEPFTNLAAYVAGQAFREYRRRGGPRTHLLPDFMIGAHALTLGVPILTRDPHRFTSYFPALKLVTPEAQA